MQNDQVCISVRQPWAWLILHGGKDIENRTWSTLRRGRVLIHASKGLSGVEKRLCRDLVERRELPIFLPAASRARVPRVTMEELHLGGIIGSVEIVDCVRFSASLWFEGPYGFVLRDPRPLPFVACAGQTNFFKSPLAPRSGISAPPRETSPTSPHLLACSPAQPSSPGGEA